MPLTLTDSTAARFRPSSSTGFNHTKATSLISSFARAPSKRRPLEGTAPPRCAAMGNVFISYSHKNERWKDRLVTQLGVLAQDAKLALWDDRRIAAGDDWLPAIEAAIQSSDVALMLISADFLTSNFILN